MGPKPTVDSVRQTILWVANCLLATRNVPLKKIHALESILLMRNTRLAQIALALSIAVFAVSLSQPVWECGRGGTPFDGLSVLMIGFMGLLFFDPAWFCNAIFVVGAISVFTKHRIGPKWLPLATAVLAGTALVGPYLCGVTGGPLGEGTGIALGGRLWVAAIWLASFSVFVATMAPHPGENPDGEGEG